MKCFHILNHYRLLTYKQLVIKDIYLLSLLLFTCHQSNSLPNFSRHHHQPSFFRTNSETGDYHKELSAVLEDNDFISFEASN